MRTRTVPIILISFIVGAMAARQARRHSGSEEKTAPLTGVPDLADGMLGRDTGTAAAWKSLLSAGGQGISDRLVQAELASRATSQEMPRLLEYAGDDPRARELLLRRWAELDPSAAASWLEPLMKMDDWIWPERQAKDVETVFSIWAKNDPAAALAALRARSTVGNGIARTVNVLNRLLDEDMEAGVRLGGLTGVAMDLSQTYYRPNSVKWIRQDPVKAAALLSTLPEGEFRNWNLTAAIDALAKTDLAAAIALQERFPSLPRQEPTQDAREDFFKEWARKDLPALTAFLKDSADGRDQPMIKSAIAEGIAALDPREALDWTAGHLNGRQRAEAEKKILSDLARKNPDAALDYLNSLPRGTALSAAVETFSAALAESKADGLLARAGSLPEGDAKIALTAKAFEKMYQKDPGGMLTSLAAKPAPELPEGIWRQLGETTDNLQTGISRVDALPPGAAADFVHGLFQRNIDWMDFPKFSEALNSLADPAERSAAMDGAMPKLLLNNATQVAGWAKSLPPSERAQVADLMEKHIYNLTDNMRKELIAPLR